MIRKDYLEIIFELLTTMFCTLPLATQDLYWNLAVARD